MSFMKIAAITITYNDDFKFKEWYDHYKEYKDEIFLHIIVDNNSNQEYKEKVKNTFINSHIIERTTNGGCTGAYNDGIGLALANQEVDAIMLIANDIKLKKGAASILYDTLYNDSSMGMISPVLLKSNTDSIIEDFGCSITSSLMMKEFSFGKNISELSVRINYCESLTGGMNLSKRVFYEKVGLQDNNLFMYSDEVDMGLRAKKNGFTMASIIEAVCWHEHINKNISLDKRDSYTKYLIGRNKVYLAKKHFGLLKIVYIYLFYTSGAIYKVINNLIRGNFDQVKDYSWLLFGATMGLLGFMKSNRFSVPKQDLELPQSNSL